MCGSAGFVRASRLELPPSPHNKAETSTNTLEIWQTARWANQFQQTTDVSVKVCGSRTDDRCVVRLVLFTHCVWSRLRPPHLPQQSSNLHKHTRHLTHGPTTLTKTFQITPGTREFLKKRETVAALAARRQAYAARSAQALKIRPSMHIAGCPARRRSRFARQRCLKSPQLSQQTPTLRRVPMRSCTQISTPILQSMPAPNPCMHELVADSPERATICQ
jgi:hypothetical protein